MVRGHGSKSMGCSASRNLDTLIDTRTEPGMDQNYSSIIAYTNGPSSVNVTRGVDHTKDKDVNTSWVMEGMMSQMTQLTQIVGTMQTSMVSGTNQQGSQMPSFWQDGNANQIVGEISRLRPPTFEGSTEPTDILHWLEHFDKLFDIVNCPEENRVPVAAYYLCKGAYSWWLSVKPANHACNWDEFKTLMLKRYFPAPLCEAKLSEVLNLESVGDESVMFIAEKFLGLLRFASSIIRTEADKIKYFSKRLNPQLRLQLFNHNCNSLGEFIEKAIGAELLIQELTQKNPSFSVDKKIGIPFCFEEHKVPRPKIRGSSRLRAGKISISSATNSTVTCFNCDSSGHINTRCTVPPFVCHLCGNKGHLQKYCRSHETRR
ncbi:hypothetical protein OROGR_004021 [Orobanche gracilis]